MNILHVLSQTQPTGAETYVYTLAAKQKEQGHEVFIISDRSHFPTAARFFSQPISERNYLQRFRNIRFLEEFIDEHKIDIVHAHSRAASWVSYFAAYDKIPLISTVHGRQHLHSTPRKEDVYGERIITVCANAKEHLINEMGIESDKIATIPNPLDNLFATDQVHAEHPLRLAIIGRTSGPKGTRTGEFILHVLPKLLQRHPRLKVTFAGGPFSNLSKDSLEMIDRLNLENRGACEILSFIPQSRLLELFNSVDAVIGSGRVAINAMAIKVPSFAFGESSYEGQITPETFEKCAASNFGDISPSEERSSISYQRMLEDLVNFFDNTPPNKSYCDTLANHARRYFDADPIAQEIEKIYVSARAQKAHAAHIPVLMYHKVTKAPLESKHRIFVTEDSFRNHMRFLKENGFKPMTFHMYKTFQNFPERMPKKPIFITFDDGYRNNLELALPILKEFGFAATVFAMGNDSLLQNQWDVEKGEAPEQLMTTSELLQLQNNGIEIGAHSLTHRDLTTLSAEEARTEIVRSKELLQQRLGTEVCSFAYPYGSYNEQIKQLVREAGFDFAVATDSGALHLEQDPYAIFRVSMFPEDTEYKLWKKTSSWYRRYYRFKRGK